MLRKTTYFAMIGACWDLANARERRRMVLIYALLFLENAIALVRPIIIGRIVSTVATLQADFQPQLIFWLCAMVGNMALCWAIIGPARLMQRDFAIRIRQTFTERVYDDIASLPWNWHQEHHTGDSLERLNKAAKALYGFADFQYNYVNSFCRLVGSIVLLLVIAPQVGWVVGIAVLPIYYMIRRFDLALIKLAEAQNQHERYVAAGLLDHVGNIASLIVLRLTDAAKANISSRFKPLRAAMNRLIVVEVGKWTVFVLSLNIATALALLYYLTGHTDTRAAILAGTVVTVFQYLQQIDGSLQSFANNFQFLLGYRVDLLGVDPIIDAARHMSHTTTAIYPEWHNARIANLIFRYEDREHRTHHLDGVSLELARGKRIALVGSSGSGKSTLLRLLRGLHDPASGILTVDGLPAEFSALSAMSTLILQDAEIFENTIRYNLTCGIDADPADLDRAIHAACLQPVIDALPQGLDTDIRERGVNLSGGQKQRLALARGLYAGRDSSLLLLDEPTSSLDPVTESQIFDRLLADRADACIVASLHRLHLLDRFDHVCVMDHGRIVEEGTLSNLLAAEGKLFELWQAQKREEKENTALP